MPDDILNVNQVAELLACQPSTVEAMARDGRLPATKVGRSWVFVHSLVVEAIKARIVEQTQDAAQEQPAQAVTVVPAWPLKLERNRPQGSGELDINDLPALGCSR